MRTSQAQFSIMIEFMERYGDLSKPSAGPHGRRQNNEKWKQLTEKLNSEGSGDPRDEEKWRKVWSDFKNNTKKKNAKINQSLRRTGGGPAKKIWLTDLEERTIAIIGEMAATGMPTIPEAGFLQTLEDVQSADQPASPVQIVIEVREEHNIADELPSGAEIIGEHVVDADWNRPGCSSDPTPTSQPSQRSSSPSIDTKWVPPRKKVKKLNTAADAFIEAEKNRDRMYFELERERIRQRDKELELQEKWQDIIEKALHILDKYLDDKK